MTTTQINQDFDYTATLSASVTQALIGRAGIENRPVSVRPRAGGLGVTTRPETYPKWFVPEEARPLIGDHEWTWSTEEALTWALVIIAAADEPECLVWP